MLSTAIYPTTCLVRSYERRPAAALPAWLTNRSTRVTLLLAAIAVMSLADLALTMNQMCTTGMFEANPLAAMLVRSTQSPVALAAFKLCTLAFSLGVLFKLRSRVQAEAASWFCLAVHVFMLVQWVRYASIASGLDLSLIPHPDLVRLG